MNTRHVVIAGAAVVGAACLAGSSEALYGLAANCGITEPLSAVLPIALDVGAAVGALAWITERGDARKWGRGVALTALALSLAGNGLQHGLTLGLIEVGLPLVMAVGASLPLMLFFVIHLAALMAKPAVPGAGKRSTDSPKTRARRATNPSRASVEAPVEPAPSTEQVNEVAEAASKRDRARAFALENYPATGGEIAKAAGCGPSEADRARKWAKQQKESQAS